MVKNYKFYLLVLPVLVVTFGFLFLLSVGISQVSAADPKVWVCKYSGTPGENEFLKPGKQPIVVSSNATVGQYFNDAHGRSYVLEIQTRENTGPGNSYIGGFRCPGGDIPTPVIEKLNLTFMQPCQPIEGTPEQAEWRIRNPNDFYVEYTINKAGTGQILSGEAAPGDSFFYTPWGAQTLILIWEGGTKTKAGGNSYNGTMCEIVRPSWTLTKSVVESCVEGEDEKMYAKGMYTIRIENIGNADGYITKIVDELDTKVLEEYLYGISDDGYYFDGKIIWESNGKGLLEPGQYKEFTYELHIPESAYGTYDNTVNAYSTILQAVALGEVIVQDPPVATDSVSAELVCEIEEPKYCEATVDGETVWSSWVVDPNDETQEMRTGVVSLLDAEDNTHDCGTREIIEYQDIQEEGEVLGESTKKEEDEEEGEVLGVSIKKEEGEVLGTSIVYAQTAGGESNLIVYLIQFILVIATGYSLKLVGKKYLTL